MTDTLELVDLSQQTQDELIPPCDFWVTTDLLVAASEPCPEAATHMVRLACGDFWLCCDEHAATFRDPKCLVVCAHGPCGISALEKL